MYLKKIFIFIILSSSSYSVLGNGPCGMNVYGANPKMSKDEFTALMKSKGLFEQDHVLVRPMKGRKAPNKVIFFKDPDDNKNNPDNFTMTWHDNEKGTITISGQYYVSDLGRNTYQERKLSICKTSEEIKDVRIGNARCKLRGHPKNIIVGPVNKSTYPNCRYGLNNTRQKISESLTYSLTYISSADTSVKFCEVTKPDGTKKLIRIGR